MTRSRRPPPRRDALLLITASITSLFAGRMGRLGSKARRSKQVCGASYVRIMFRNGLNPCQLPARSPSTTCADDFVSCVHNNDQKYCLEFSPDGVTEKTI